jgi:hypothetical protein
MANGKPIEKWRDVKGYEGLYMVSNLGRVRSLDRMVVAPLGHYGIRNGVILRQKLNTSGYPFVILHYNGKPHSMTVHRLLMCAFVPNPDNKPQINHKNGIRTDNCVGNLEWCTPSENIKHSYSELGHRPNRAMKGRFGGDNPTSKPVVQYTLNGKFIAEYGGQSEAARETGILGEYISRCCRGVQNNAGGYVWKFNTTS